MRARGLPWTALSGNRRTFLAVGDYEQDILSQVKLVIEHTFWHVVLWARANKGNTVWDYHLGDQGGFVQCARPQQ